MEWIFDPTIWVGLLTLVLLEVVLGIDNLVFIAILAEKLPPAQRDKARFIGLALALGMRLLLLSAISWIVKMTAPMFNIMGFAPSMRDLMLLGGGIFLLFKATTELHERIESHAIVGSPNRARAVFWKVVVQIVALDAVFSLDAVITAVGMVNELPLMMAAVTIAVGIMLLAAKPLTAFLASRPSVVVLCLSFLLMIGFSLVAESFHFEVPKGYLYAAIGFSILIEFFNQLASTNRIKAEARRPLRVRTAETVLRLLGGDALHNGDTEDGTDQEKPYNTEAQNMLYGVLTLTDRSIRSIMTPRPEVVWINVADSLSDIRALAGSSSHGTFPVLDHDNDEVLGVVSDKDILARLAPAGDAEIKDLLQPPLVVQESIGVLRLMEIMRQSSAKMALVANEYGAILGVVTLQDIFEAIAGDFPDAGEQPDLFAEAENTWQVDGSTDLHRLEMLLDTDELLKNSGGYVTLGGYLTQQIGALPKEGSTLDVGNLHFEVLKASKRKIDRVRIVKKV